MQLIARDCPKCGAKLPATTATVTCKYCGTELAVAHPDPGVSAGLTNRARSEDTRAKVTITFVNARGTGLSLVWLDFAGAEKSYGDLPAGEQRVFDTYVGHVWSVRDASGTEVMRWAARDQVPRHVHVR